jgi:hypothetical protein
VGRGGGWGGEGTKISQDFVLAVSFLPLT